MSESFVAVPQGRVWVSATYRHRGRNMVPPFWAWEQMAKPAMETPQFSRPKKSKAVHKSTDKVMITFFFDCRGPLLVIFLEHGATINAKHYVDTLLKLWCAINSKRPGMLSDRIMLLHDNIHPHTVNLVRDKLQRFGWETLQHPPYSPDLSPCDFRIFGDLKKDICGHRFHSDEEVQQEWMRLWIHQRPTSFYKTGIDCLVSQWDKCIKTSGNITFQ